MNDTFEMNILGNKIKEISHFNLLYNERKIIQPKLRRILTKDNVWKNTIIVMNFLGGGIEITLICICKPLQQFNSTISIWSTLGTVLAIRSERNRTQPQPQQLPRQLQPSPQQQLPSDGLLLQIKYGQQSQQLQEHQEKQVTEIIIGEMKTRVISQKFDQILDPYFKWASNEYS